MDWFLTWFLRKFPPETAHRFAVGLLKIYQALVRWFPSPSSKFPNISIRVSAKNTFQLKSRLGLAAGFDKHAELFPALLQLGFGFLEIGTVTPLPQSGNPKPRVWRVGPNGLVNQMGFNSVGIETFKKNIQRYRNQNSGVVLANIGKNRHTSEQDALFDYEVCLKALKNTVDGFVINISSPNTPGLRNLQNTHFLERLVRVLDADKPVFIKLSPDLDNDDFRKLCEFIDAEEKLSGLVLTNTSRTLAEKNGFAMGGLSGPDLFPLSLDRVKEARKTIAASKTIIGVGGISSIEDAIKMREAGADLLEIYTAFVYQGPKLVRKLSQILK